MRTVRLLGELGKKFGRVHRLAVRSPAEAIRALRANFPGFESELLASERRGVGYRVFVGAEDVGAEELQHPAGRASIKIVPVLTGAGNVGKILLGAALIAAGAVISGLTFGAAAPIGQGLIYAGIGLALGGVSGLLVGTPKAPDVADIEDQKPSYVFNGAVNTTAQGNPVPVLYGRMVVGSAVLSAGIDGTAIGPAYGWSS